MNYTKKIFLALILCTGLAASADAQFVVKIRPPRPTVVVTRPPAPTPAHVWVEEDWTWRDGRYEHTGGYWAAPPHRGWRWHGGHWNHARGGYAWVPGHWRRR